MKHHGSRTNDGWWYILGAVYFEWKDEPDELWSISIRRLHIAWARR